MGTVNGEYEDFDAANRRAEVIDWLGGLLPEFDLPLDSSDEELRDYLIDGEALCYVADKLMPGVLEGTWGGYASDQRSNVKKFLSVVAEMGLPGFGVKDLEEVSDNIEHQRCIDLEIEHRIGIQADHIRNQNSIIKTREDKYRSKIKALETLVNGTNEENEMAINRLEVVKVEKSKIDEKRKLGEQDMIRLIREKDNAENIIASLHQEMQVMNRMHEQFREQMETKARQMEEHLTLRAKEAEFCLMQSKKKVEEVEATSQLKSQLWSKKANIFQSFMNNQKLSIKDIKISSQSIKQEMYALQMTWRDEISNIGHDLKGLVDAAENYHKVLAENQKLFNEVQELKGNIRVYCRVRPFLPGQDGKLTAIDYIGENGEILIANPSKQGKEGYRMFKFNKVFGTHSSQAEVFSDIQPLIRSVLDGFNVCIFAYGQTGSGKTYTMSGPGTSREDWGVNYRALNDLFDISLSRKNAFSYEVGVQMVEIYNEQPNGLVVPDASLHPVKSTSDVLDLMEIGQSNRAVGSTALNERSSRSHSILTVHVRGLDVKNGSTSRGCLHLIDLAGSERVERSEATGDRLKEAQHINKSLSALGDVIFSLAQKNAHVPYRNSKLTQVLQSSLGGQAKTLMFVQINPDVESYSETISTLKFAERVSGVELGAARSNREGKDIKELLEQVASLKDTIARKDMEIEQLQLLKSKSPNSMTERNGSNLLRQSTSSTGLSSLPVASQQNQQLSGSVEAEAEDNASDDGCSVGETEYSPAGASETSAERAHKAPSRITRFFLTKNGQPSTSRPKPREVVPKTQGSMRPGTAQATGGSLAKPSKRR
uniref:Kinesin motor domain-containing protein n=1 Tax=Oryza meridionalis TaxID=40149 RepID=A0A0E0DZ66_9ORYZ